MSMDKALFLRAVRDPAHAAGFTLPQWDEFLPMAHQLGMMPRLVARLETLGLLEPLPEQVGTHVESALLLGRRHEQLVRWEAKQLQQALGGLGIPVVLLKGAAYLLSGLNIAHGRMYSDVDILVPKSALADVESTLLAHGWTQQEETEGQEQYYRRWLHELLPLIHERRRSKLDVHHNMLPAIDKRQFDPALLLADARPLEDHRGLYVLSPTDMVLHNVVHLFRNGDYRRALRDLLDFQQMLEQFSEQPGFHRHLLERAKQLDLLTPCYLAARYAVRYLDAQIAPELLQGFAAGRPAWPPVALLDRLVELASFPTQLTGSPTVRRWALWLLERYPLHLLRKSVVPKLERLGIPTAAPRF
jgi:hypothetical protein